MADIPIGDLHLMSDDLLIETIVQLQKKLAEADQFRDAAKMVPAASDPDPLHLSRILHELAGAASMCWIPRPSTAVFDSQQAIVFVEQAIAEIRQRMQAMSAVPQPVGAAEVPMPEPIGWLYWTGTRIGDGPPAFCTYKPTAHSIREQVVLLSDVRTYGDAREAAGYVAGVAAGVAALVALKPQSGVNSDGTAWLLPISRQDCVEAVAALRGEVKP